MFDLVSDAAGAALAVVLLRGVVGRTRDWRRTALLFVGLAVLGVLAATFGSW